MPPPPSRSQEYFDGWYAAMAVSPHKDEIMQRHLGLPAHLLVNSTVPWTGLDEVARLLRLRPGDRLLDLACGRGRLGQELARRTRTALVGVDFSPEAVRQAKAHAHGLDVEATYVVGDLSDTGLPDSDFDAVVVIDSIQFAESTRAALREIRRLLRADGRVVLTGWQPSVPGDDAVPARLRDLDLATDLRAEGFREVAVTEQPAWRSVELEMWAEAASIEPDGDPALESFQEEGARTGAAPDLLRRVLASATRGHD